MISCPIMIIYVLCPIYKLLFKTRRIYGVIETARYMLLVSDCFYYYLTPTKDSIPILDSCFDSLVQRLDHCSHCLV